MNTVSASAGLTQCARENKRKNPLDKVCRCMLPSGESFPHESRSYVQEGPAPPRRMWNRLLMLLTGNRWLRDVWRKEPGDILGKVNFNLPFLPPADKHYLYVTPRIWSCKGRGKGEKWMSGKNLEKRKHDHTINHQKHPTHRGTRKRSQKWLWLLWPSIPLSLKWSVKATS